MMHTMTIDKPEGIVIKDMEGKPIAVSLVLTIEEYNRYREFLTVAAKLDSMAEAATDPAFLQDLEETMDAFAVADTDWWEHE
jgi:hypothetical protein